MQLCQNVYDIFAASMQRSLTDEEEKLTMCQNIDGFIMKITQTINALLRGELRPSIALQDERIETQILRNVTNFAKACCTVIIVVSVGARVKIIFVIDLLCAHRRN